MLKQKVEKSKEISNKTLANLSYLNFLTVKFVQAKQNQFQSKAEQHQKKYDPINNIDKNPELILPFWAKPDSIAYEDKICDKLISSFRHNEKGTFNCMKVKK